jgi:hypothetical protein
MVAFPVFPSLVAMMIAVPAVTPVAMPVFGSIEATPGLLEDHVTVLSVSVFPASSLSVALNDCVPPIPIVADGGATVTDATGAGGGGGAGATVSVNDFETDCGGLAASLTVTETLNVPAMDAVPAMEPVEELIERPAGKPSADQVYAPWPPLAFTVCAYAMPTVASGSDAVVMAMAGMTAVIVIDSALDTDCCGLPASVTETVKLKVPVVVGVPEIAPVDALIVTPSGIVPVTDHA